MRVMILMGSPLRNGNTAELCKPFMEELKCCGAEVEYVYLHNKKIAACVGCKGCQKKDDYGCVQQDDMQELIRHMLQSDVLIFATPSYTWQVTTSMKSVMDRMFGLIKYDDSGIKNILNEGQAYALLATCGDEIEHGLGLLDGVFKEFCQYSKRPYLGMYAVRDEHGLASFQTESAIAGARQFARKIVQYIPF